MAVRKEWKRERNELGARRPKAREHGGMHRLLYIEDNPVNVVIVEELLTTRPDIELRVARTDRTRAIMVAHTLGNPFELDAIVAFAKKYNLWLIEDCCDAVGSTYRGKQVGTFGDLATVSFYPAHHLTMGEGGCVLYDRPVLDKLVTSAMNTKAGTSAERLASVTAV